MALVEVKCPQCKGKEVIKYGQTTNKKQRYICKIKSVNKKVLY
jgi:transposase-like protein